MKNILFLIFFIVGFSVFAQENKADIERQFQEYSDFLKNKKFERAIDQYANEDMLKIVPKAQLLQSMDQIFNSKEIEFKIYNPENINIDSQVYKKNNKEYYKLNYNQRIDLKFNSNAVSNDQLMTALQKEFGENNVLFNSQTGYFEIKTNKDAAASTSNHKEWKFTVLEKNQIPILRSFLPEELLKSMN